MKNYSPDVLVTLDADLVELNTKSIDFMVEKLVRKRKNMVFAGVAEEGAFYDIEVSGQRAIKYASLNPILVGNKKWYGLLQNKRYGLEVALNHLIPNSMNLTLALFKAKEALRKGSEQIKQISSVIIEINRRRDTAREILSLKKHYPEKYRTLRKKYYENFRFK